MALPNSLPVKQLDAQHAEYASYHDAWDELDLLYQGGAAIRAAAQRFLVKRPKELAEVFAARVQRFAYQNVIGPALGWYQSSMFEDDPDVHIRRNDADVTDEFYVRFLGDCDRGGTGFIDFARKVFLSSLLFRSAWVLIDLPKPDAQPATLADQRKLGALDPYLVLYDPRQVINWECDSYGNLLWVVIATTVEERSLGQSPRVIDRWYYFDRTDYAVYEAARQDPSRKQDVASLVAEGRHAMADHGRVPIRRMELPDGLWMGNRGYLSVLAHLNLQNAYHWGLMMSCLPVAVISGEYNDPPTVSEVSYIKLGETGKFYYAEPSGVSYKIAGEEVGVLREEIYRQLHLQAQGRSTAATPSAQSGYSKEMDARPSDDILNGLGDYLRAFLQLVLGDVARIHGDADIRVDVRGFAFDDDNADAEIATAQAEAALAIPSDTLEREMHKRVARCLLKDARPEVIKAVEQEIDAAPSRSEREAQQAQQQQQRMEAAVGQAFASKVA